MPLTKQKYVQLTKADSSETLDKYSFGLLKRIWFKVNKELKIIIYEGLSAWRNRSYSGVFVTDGWTLIPFDVQEFKSQWINIWKDSLHKFRVGKSGYYEFNVNWLSEISDIVTLKTLGTKLAIAKNGDAEGTDNFVRLDSRILTIPITGVASAWAYSNLSHLQGTKGFYMEKDVDYVEFFFWHTSQNNLGAESVHSGFVEIKYMGTKARSLL